MNNMIFDCEAISVLPKDSKSVWVHGFDMGCVMTLEEIRDFGKAIVPVSYTHLTLPTNREV